MYKKGTVFERNTTQRNPKSCGSLCNVGTNSFHCATLGGHASGYGALNLPGSYVCALQLLLTVPNRWLHKWDCEAHLFRRQYVYILVSPNKAGKRVNLPCNKMSSAVSLTKLSAYWKHYWLELGDQLSWYIRTYQHNRSAMIWRCVSL
jgi:hypothetical protein